MYLDTNNNKKNKSRVLHFKRYATFLGTGPISRKGVKDGSWLTGHSGKC